MHKLPERFTVPSHIYDQLRDLTKWAQNTPEFVKEGFFDPRDKKQSKSFFNENVYEWQQLLFNDNVKEQVPDPEVDGFVVSTFRTTGPCDALWAVFVDDDNKEIGDALIYRDL